MGKFKNEFSYYYFNFLCVNISTIQNSKWICMPENKNWATRVPAEFLIWIFFLVRLWTSWTFYACDCTFLNIRRRKTHSNLMPDDTAHFVTCKLFFFKKSSDFHIWNKFIPLNLPYRSFSKLFFLSHRTTISNPD